MKNKKIIFIISLIVVVPLSLLIINEIVPIIKEKDYKNRVFTEMQNNDVIRGIVGIIP